jgi:bifunctional DNase/RNase
MGMKVHQKNHLFTNQARFTMKHSTIFLALCVGFVILVLSGYLGRSEDNSDLLEVDVEGLVIDPTTNSPVVILVGKEYKKALPIFIGTGEAGAIARGMKDIETARPMTHDLMKSILDGLDAEVERVIITDLIDNIFFAQIIIRIGKTKKTIDSRPSDAIALAVRTGTPIFVNVNVMEKSSSSDLTGWVVEENLTKQFGFKVQNLSKELLEAMNVDVEEGVLVSHVMDGSPAEKGGLNRGDIILRLQGEKVRDVEAFDELLVKLPNDKEIQIAIFSPNGEREIHLVPQKKDD